MNRWALSREIISNARFCETCGEPTYFFKQGFLKPWEEKKADLEQKNEMNILEYHTLDGVEETSESEDDVFDGDLHFNIEIENNSGLINLC